MAAVIGRPSIYSEELASEICARLAEGESVRQICKDQHMPVMSAIFRWLSDPSRESFKERYAEARESWLEHLAQEILSIGDDGTNDYMDRETKAGRIIRVPDRELTQRSQIRIEARKWLLSKLRPDKYGDRAINGSNEITVNIRSVLDAPIAAEQPRKGLPPGSSATR